jgi:hypothetical protein
MIEGNEGQGNSLPPPTGRVTQLRYHPFWWWMCFVFAVYCARLIAKLVCGAWPSWISFPGLLGLASMGIIIHVLGNRHVYARPWRVSVAMMMNIAAWNWVAVDSIHQQAFSPARLALWAMLVILPVVVTVTMIHRELHEDRC